MKNVKLQDMLKKEDYILRKARLAADLGRLDLFPQIEEEFELVSKEIALFLEEEERERKNKQMKSKTRRTNRPPPT